MFIDDKGSKMTPFEEALLAHYDGKIALALVNEDRNGHCNLTEAFICKLFEQVWNTPDGCAVVTRIVSCNDFLTPKMIDTIFATKNAEQIEQYLHLSRGYGMESRHVIELLELGSEDLVNFYFKRYATFVFTDEWYRPVVEYLRKKGIYNAYRAKFMPERKFGKD